MPSNGKKLANQQRRRYQALFQSRQGASHTSSLSVEEYAARPANPVLEARRLKFNAEQRERNHIIQERYQASKTTAQRQQAETSPATPNTPRTFTKRRIVRTKYHVRSEVLIEDLSEPPVPTVTGVLSTYERTMGWWRIAEINIDNSQESRTGVNACSIRTKLYKT